MGLLSRNNTELRMIFENPWRAFSNLEILCFWKTQTGLYNASEDSEFPIRDHAWRWLRRIFFRRLVTKRDRWIRTLEADGRAESTTVLDRVIICL